MGVLNDYLAYLPTVFNSLMAIAGTKKMNVPFDEADLAGIVLNLVPSSWGNQYNMMQSTLPKNPKALLNNLEAIKRVMDEKQSASLKAKAKEASAASAAAKGSSKNHLAPGSSGELQVPKKAGPNKFCQHCMAKGGPHLTHKPRNTIGMMETGIPFLLSKVSPQMLRSPLRKGTTSRWLI
jgi:hypothetical protein